MQRYVLTALSMGVGAAAVVIVAIFLGAFSGMAGWLESFFLSRNFVSADSMNRLFWLELILVVVVSIGVSWCVIDVAQVGQKVLIACCCGVLTLGLAPTLALYGVVFDPLPALVGATIAAVGGFIFSGTERGMRKRVLQDLLGRRVSHQTFNALLSADHPPDFDGAVREVTVLTCRIFNHGELREKLEPSDLMKMSNLFLRSVSTFLTSRGAYLDESGAELVRVFFGMIQPSEDHAERACRAALELRSRLRNLNQECESRWFQPLLYGIGINSGPMTVGVYGSRGHFYFSGVGAVTEYSRRLAQANSRYGSDLLVGAEAYHQLRDRFEFRPMEMFYDPDKEIMTEIYQLLATETDFSEEQCERRDLFWEGVILLREKQYDEALQRFSKVRIAGGGDQPAEYFLAMAQEALANPDGAESNDATQLTDEGHARLISQM
ncbi:MAG: adenylate/guanylate cyclase domain-containing protein [Verrucomicrobiota bacterium]